MAIKHSPGCTCCGESTCTCPTSGNTYPLLTGTPYVKVVIAGLAASYTADIVRTNGGTGQIEDFDAEILNLDDANGTYYLEIARLGSGCFDFDGTTPTSANVHDQSLAWDRYNFSCTLLGSNTSSLSCGTLVSALGNTVAGTFDANFNDTTTSSFLRIYGSAKLVCDDDFIQGVSTGTYPLPPGLQSSGNTIDVDVGGGEIWARWPLSSAADAASCSLTYDSADPFQIGTISAEIVWL